MAWTSRHRVCSFFGIEKGSWAVSTVSYAPLPCMWYFCLTPSTYSLGVDARAVWELARSSPISFMISFFFCSSSAFSSSVKSSGMLRIRTIAHDGASYFHSIFFHVLHSKAIYYYWSGRSFCSGFLYFGIAIGYQWVVLWFPLLFYVVPHIYWSSRSRIVSLAPGHSISLILSLSHMCFACICSNCGSFILSGRCMRSIVDGSLWYRICICIGFFFCSVRSGFLFGGIVYHMLRIGRTHLCLRVLVLRIQKRHDLRSPSCLLFSFFRSSLELLFLGSIPVLVELSLSDALSVSPCFVYFFSS